MPEPSRKRTGCVWLLAVFLCGGVLGLTVGIAASALFYWALDEVVREQAIDPLAELALPPGELNEEQIEEPVRRLATEFLAQDGNVGLVVGILKEGHRRSFGFGAIQRGSPQPPDGDTVFEIASVGKTFTTAVLADMHLEEGLSLDTPVDDLLPNDVKCPSHSGQRITLEHLATHRSGLPSLPDNFEPVDPLNPYKDYSVEEMYEALQSTKLTNSIGSEYAYSNLGFGLLGHALARRAGVDYEQLVIDRLCVPLAMNSTKMTLDDVLQSRLATPHDNGTPVPVWEDTTMPGAGSFLSTSSDMLTYLEAHFSEENGSPYAALRMTLEKRSPSDSPSIAMGLGWHITSENALDVVWHNGGAGGSSSYVAMLPEHRTAVVVFANSNSPVDALGHKLLYLVHRHWQP